MKKVIYQGCCDEQVRWGNNDDPRGLLEVGKVYEVQETRVHSFHTKYILKDFPNEKFNSVCFELIDI